MAALVVDGRSTPTRPAACLMSHGFRQFQGALLNCRGGTILFNSPVIRVLLAMAALYRVIHLLWSTLIPAIRIHSTALRTICSKCQTLVNPSVCMRSLRLLCNGSRCVVSAAAYANCSGVSSPTNPTSGESCPPQCRGCHTRPCRGCSMTHSHRSGGRKR